MATVSMTLGPVIDNRTISSDHLTRFLSALHEMYDPKGEYTDQQVAAKWVDVTLDSIKEITRAHEQRKAASDAINAVDDIEVI